MLWYVLKLVILLPLIAGLAYGSLRLAKKLQLRAEANHGPRRVRVIETQMLGPSLRLAVLEFDGREILVSASRNGMVRLAEAGVQERGE